MKSTQAYFVYNALKLPFTKEKARVHLHTFVHDVIEAIEELHTTGLAHQD